MTQPELTVHEDGAWFRVDGGQPVDLRTRARYRVLLRMLVREHLRDPAATISVAAVIREVWPDEKLRHSVARNRAYVAMCSLRKWGLEGLVLRTAHGYHFDPNVQLTLVDTALPESAVVSTPAVQEALSSESAQVDSFEGTQEVLPSAEVGFEAPQTEQVAPEPAPQRELHSMRVRLVEVPDCGDDREALERLVG